MRERERERERVIGEGIRENEIEVLADIEVLVMNDLGFQITNRNGRSTFNINGVKSDKLLNLKWIAMDESNH